MQILVMNTPMTQDLTISDSQTTVKGTRALCLVRRAILPQPKMRTSNRLLSLATHDYLQTK